MKRLEELVGAVALATHRAITRGEVWTVYGSEHAMRVSGPRDVSLAAELMLVTVFPNATVTLHSDISKLEA